MKIKDLIKNVDIKLKTKVAKDGERFNVAVQLNLSKEELLSLGLSEPKVKRKEGVKVAEPTLKDIVLQLTKSTQEGFSEMRKDNKEIHNRLDNIEKDLKGVHNRLDNIEGDLKEVRDLPMIKNEIKNSRGIDR